MTIMWHRVPIGGTMLGKKNVLINQRCVRCLDGGCYGWGFAVDTNYMTGKTDGPVGQVAPATA
jgi:hypothetical protein